MCPNPILGIFHMYGLMIGLGIIVAFALLFFYGKKYNVEEKFIDFIFYNGIASIAVGFVFAALFQATYNYIDNPAGGFKLGGITFIGGLIGGIACFMAGYAIFRKRYNARLIDVVSFLPCCIVAAHGFGRVGCFFAGCCYGKETDSILGIKFPKLSAPVHPTQLYEAVFLFALFALFFYLYTRKKFKHNLSLYLILYGIFRFLIEFLRGDDRGELLGIMSPSQFWSIVMIIAGVATYFILESFYQKREIELQFLNAEQEKQVTQETQVTQEKQNTQTKEENQNLEA